MAPPAVAGAGGGLPPVRPAEHVGPGPGRRGAVRGLRAIPEGPVRPGGPVGRRPAGSGVAGGRGAGRREGAARGAGGPGAGAGADRAPAVGRGGTGGGGPGAAAGRDVEVRLPAVERVAGDPAGRVRPGVQGPDPGRGVSEAGQGRGRSGRLPGEDVGGVAPPPGAVPDRGVVPDTRDPAGEKRGPRR